MSARERQAIYANRINKNIASFSQISAIAKTQLEQLIDQRKTTLTCSIEQLSDADWRDLLEDWIRILSIEDKKWVNQAGIKTVSKYSLYSDARAKYKLLAIAEFLKLTLHKLVVPKPTIFQQPIQVPVCPDNVEIEAASIHVSVGGLIPPVMEKKSPIPETVEENKDVIIPLPAIPIEAPVSGPVIIQKDITSPHTAPVVATKILEPAPPSYANSPILKPAVVVAPGNLLIAPAAPMSALTLVTNPSKIKPAIAAPPRPSIERCFQLISTHCALAKVMNLADIDFFLPQIKDPFIRPSRTEHYLGIKNGVIPKLDLKSKTISNKICGVGRAEKLKDPDFKYQHTLKTSTTLLPPNPLCIPHAFRISTDRSSVLDDAALTQKIRMVPYVGIIVDINRCALKNGRYHFLTDGSTDHNHWLDPIPLSEHPHTTPAINHCPYGPRKEAGKYKYYQYSTTIDAIREHNNEIMRNYEKSKQIVQRGKWPELLVGLPQNGVEGIFATSDHWEMRLLAFIAKELVKHYLGLEYDIPILIIARNMNPVLPDNIVDKGDYTAERFSIYPIETQREDMLRFQKNHYRFDHPLLNSAAFTKHWENVMTPNSNPKTIVDRALHRSAIPKNVTTSTNTAQSEIIPHQTYQLKKHTSLHPRAGKTITPIIIPHPSYAQKIKLTEQTLLQLFCDANKITIHIPYPVCAGGEGYSVWPVGNTGLITYRLNHNGPHAMRKVKLFEALISAIKKVGQAETKKIVGELSESEIFSLKMASFSSRVGRVDETNQHSAYPDCHQERSAEIYSLYAMETDLPQGLIDWTANLMRVAYIPGQSFDSSDKKLALMVELFYVAHNLDLYRCFNASQMGDIENKLQLTMHKHVQDSPAFVGKMVNYSKKLLEACGVPINGTVYGTIEQQTRSYVCSVDLNICIQNINAVPVPNF